MLTYADVCCRYERIDFQTRVRDAFWRLYRATLIDSEGSRQAASSSASSPVHSWQKFANVSITVIYVYKWSAQMHYVSVRE